MIFRYSRERKEPILYAQARVTYCSHLFVMCMKLIFFSTMYMAPKGIPIRSCKGVHGLGFIGPKSQKKFKNGFISATRVLGVNPYDTGSSHVSNPQWPRLFALTTTKLGLGVRWFILSSLPKNFSLSLSEAISRATPTAGASLHLIDDRLFPPRSQVRNALIHG